MRKDKQGSAWKPAALVVSFCLVAAASAAEDSPWMTGPGDGVPDAFEQALLADVLVESWSRVVPEGQREAWRALMAERIEAADPLNLRIAAEAPTYEQAIAALGGAVDASDPLQPLALGSTTFDLTYSPLTPCRIVDTRNAGGLISGGFNRTFEGRSASGYEDQGGQPGTTCGIPVDATALALNVTVVNPAANGYATVYPANVTMPAASSLNFSTGTNLSNTVLVRLSAAQQFRIYSHRDAHYVVDVVGYYSPPQATALQCLTREQFVVVSPSASALASATCDAGYTMSGGGCFWRGSTNSGPIQAGYPAIGSEQVYYCRGTNTTAGDRDLFSRVRCCRVPGR